MAKHQTRRTVTVSREFHDQLAAHARRTGQSCSSIVERALAPILGTARPAHDLVEDEDDEPGVPRADVGRPAGGLEDAVHAHIGDPLADTQYLPVLSSADYPAPRLSARLGGQR